MNKTILTPLAVLLGIGGIIALMAGTNIFNSLVKFIHSEAISPMEFLVCLFFTVIGFATCYFLLNTLCTYFVPRMGKPLTNSGNTLKK